MKRYVLPSIKILLALVIAVALTKIAFFPSHDGSSAEPEAGFAPSTQTVTAQIGDISNTVDVKGQIVQDAPVQAQATLAGTVESLSVDKGAAVAQGDALMVIKHAEPQEPISVLASDHRYRCPASGEEPCETIDQPDKVTRATVYAPVAGTVTFSVIKDQETSVGTVVASVRPGTYSAVGTITASQQYQLASAPTTAMLTVENGPAPFECSGLTIGTKEAATTDGSDAQAAPADGTSVEVRCPVPAEQKVFPGLPVTIGIDAGSATGVVTVPVTAVEGSVTTGNVWVVTDPANPDSAEKREISLGINDGTSVEVTEGLAEGDEILMFVPGKVTLRTGEPGTCDEFACYDDNGQEQL